MNTQPDIVSLLDQVQTNLENISTLIATFYGDLTKKGVSDELAQKLCIELFKSFFPNK